MLSHTQDPADPFTHLTEKVRRMRAARHGIAAPVVLLICDLFAQVLKLLAGRAERVGTGELADPAPARSEQASPAPESVPDPSRVMAPGMLPRQSGRLWRWMLGADMSGGQLCSPLQQPDMAPVSAATPQPEQMPRVKPPAERRLPAEPRLPRRPCVRKLQETSGRSLAACGRRQVAARPRIAAAMDYGRRVLTLNSQKSVSGAGRWLVQIVPDKQR